MPPIAIYRGDERMLNSQIEAFERKQPTHKSDVDFAQFVLPTEVYEAYKHMKFIPPHIFKKYGNYESIPKEYYDSVSTVVSFYLYADKELKRTIGKHVKKDWEHFSTHFERLNELWTKHIFI